MPCAMQARRPGSARSTRPIRTRWTRCSRCLRRRGFAASTRDPQVITVVTGPSDRQRRERPRRATRTPVQARARRSSEGSAQWSRSADLRGAFGGRHRLPFHGASRSIISSVCRHARRRAALRPNAAPSATTAITSTSTSREMPAAAVIVAVVEYPPITNGSSATLAHRRGGRVLHQRLIVNLLPRRCRDLSRGPALRACR